MINPSIPSITPRFSGFNTETGIDLMGVKPGETVFIKTSDESGRTRRIEAAKLVKIEGHQGQSIGGIQVPDYADDGFDFVNKVTLTDLSGGNPRGLLTGAYYTEDSRNKEIPISNTRVYSLENTLEDFAGMISQNNALSDALDTSEGHVARLRQENEVLTEKRGGLFDLVDTLLEKLREIHETSKLNHDPVQRPFMLTKIETLSDTKSVIQAKNQLF